MFIRIREREKYMSAKVLSGTELAKKVKARLKEEVEALN